MFWGLFYCLSYYIIVRSRAVFFGVIMHIKKISFFICFTVFLCFSAAQAFANPYANRCPRHQIKTKLVAKQLKTKFYHNSIQGINSYLNQHNVLAFVQNPLSIQAQYKFNVKELGDSLACVVLEEVKVHYIAAPRIVMPSDYKRNSCEYKLILQHEKRHLKVHYDYFEQSKSEYQTYLGRIARAVPIFPPVSSAEDAQDVQMKLKGYFEEELEKHITNSLMQMYGLQAKIDSSQEYLFTGRKIERCAQLEKDNAKQNSKVFYDR